MTRVDSPVPLMHHDPDRSWITDPDPDHPKGTHPKSQLSSIWLSASVTCDQNMHRSVFILNGLLFGLSLHFGICKTKNLSSL